MVEISQLVECETLGQGHWRHSFVFLPLELLSTHSTQEDRKTRQLVLEILEHLLRVPTSSGNHGKWKKSWNLKKKRIIMEKSWNFVI